MLDQERAAVAAQRFIATAPAAAEPAAGDTGGLADLAYAALVNAVGLTRVHLGGLSNRRARAWLASQADQRGGSSEPEHSVRVIVRAARRKIEQTPDRPGDGPVPMGESRFDATGYAGLWQSTFHRGLHRHVTTRQIPGAHPADHPAAAPRGSADRRDRRAVPAPPPRRPPTPPGCGTARSYLFEHRSSAAPQNSALIIFARSVPGCARRSSL